MVTLRPATTGDIAFIMATERLPGYDVLVGSYEEDVHRANLADDNWLYLIAEDEGGTPQGFAVLQNRHDGDGSEFIRRVAVANAGQGFGKPFLGGLIDWIFANSGNTRCHLHVREDNARARHVYGALGFEDAGPEQGVPNSRIMILTKAAWSQAVASPLQPWCSALTTRRRRTMTTLTKAHIDTVRGFYAGINGNDIPAMIKTLDPNFAWTEPDSYPNGGTRHGRQAVEAHMLRSRATWAEGACTPERFIVAGDKIVVPIHIRVRVKEAADWIEGRAADVFTFKDGRLVEGRHFAEKADALAFADAKE